MTGPAPAAPPHAFPQTGTAPLIRLAQPSDAPAVLALIESMGLGMPEVIGEPDGLLVIDDDQTGRPVACVGWEDHGDFRLLRSCGVARTHRGQGWGGLLLDAAMGWGLEPETAAQISGPDPSGSAHPTASGQGPSARQPVTQAGLLTVSAADFFAQRGFMALSRDHAPHGMKVTRSFRSHGCDDAVVMVRSTRPAWRIRKAREEDMPEVLAIYNGEIRSSTSTYRFEERTLAEQMAFFHKIQGRGHGFFVAEHPHTGAIGGFASYSWFRAREGWRPTCEHSVYLHADWRGQGLARLLMPAILSHARLQGFHRMVGVVDAANAASVMMHRHFGFELMGVLNQGGRKFDRWLDVAFLVARLDQQPGYPVTGTSAQG